MKEEHENYIDISNLPRIKKGVDWKNCINKIVHFSFNGCESTLTIKNYIKKGSTVVVEFNNKLYSIHSSSLRNCMLSNLFPKDFLYKIGEVINNKKILEKIILDRDDSRHRCFAYRVECQICKNIYIIREDHVLTSKGCKECSHIDEKLICNARPDLKIYFQEKDLRYFYTKSVGSSLKLDFICPICKEVKHIAINTLCRSGLGCTNCSDKISFGEKFFRNILEQLSVNYIYQFKFKNTTLYNDKEYKPSYDFCIPSMKLIIEIDGEQHYEDNNFFNNNQKEKDIIKDKFASDNGYELIRILYKSYDYDNFMYNITTKLNKYFSFDNIDITTALHYATNPLVKLFSELWNDGLGTMQIVNKTSYDKSIVTKYLKLSNELGFTDYSFEKSRKRGREVAASKRRKSIVCIETNDIFESCKKCSEVSIEKFGLRIGETSIRNNIKGYSKSAGGLHFKYA